MRRLHQAASPFSDPQHHWWISVALTDLYIRLVAANGESTGKYCRIARYAQCTLSEVPRIFGGCPGCGFGSSSSRSLIGGVGRKMASRFFALPFPLSFGANGLQHSEQIS